MSGNKIYMHESTYQYLKNNIDLLSVSCGQRIIHDGFGNFIGLELVIDDNLRPTINEPLGQWIFPRNDFYSYGPEDESWCRFFKIGYEGRGLQIGEIIKGDGIVTFSPPKIKRYIMTLEGPKRV